MEQGGVVDSQLQGFPRDLHEPVHVGLEPGQVLGHGVQVQIMDNYQVALEQED